MNNIKWILGITLAMTIIVAALAGLRNYTRAVAGAEQARFAQEATLKALELQQEHAAKVQTALTERALEGAQSERERALRKRQIEEAIHNATDTTLCGPDTDADLVRLLFREGSPCTRDVQAGAAPKPADGMPPAR